MALIDPGQVLQYAYDAANNAIRISGGLPTDNGTVTTPNSSATPVVTQAVTTGLIGFFTVKAIGHDAVTPNYVAINLQGVVQNSAGTVTFPTAAMKTIIADTTGGAATVGVAASSTPGAFDVTVTGITGKTFKWNVYVQYIES